MDISEESKQPISAPSTRNAREDEHFWVKDICTRLPIELLPKNPCWSSLLSAVTHLKKERNNAMHRVRELESAMKECIEENNHLADGDNCTLIKLKRAINQDEIDTYDNPNKDEKTWTQAAVNKITTLTRRIDFVEFTKIHNEYAVLKFKEQSCVIDFFGKVDWSEQSE